MLVHTIEYSNAKWIGVGVVHSQLILVCQMQLCCMLLLGLNRPFAFCSWSYLVPHDIFVQSVVILLC